MSMTLLFCLIAAIVLLTVSHLLFLWPERPANRRPPRRKVTEHRPYWLDKRGY